MEREKQQIERRWCVLGAALWLAGCAGTRQAPPAGAIAEGALLAPDASASASVHGRLRFPEALREALLARTMLVVNTPYTFGGNSPEGGFDCSGLVQWAVRGLVTQSKPGLPRSTAQWAQASLPLQRDMQRGDFVFFNTLGGRYSHMGIFVGNGQFVHAPSKGGTVQRVRMDQTYFSKRFTEARSIFV